MTELFAKDDDLVADDAGDKKDLCIDRLLSAFTKSIREGSWWHRSDVEANLG